jgi:hypothetical protein
VGDRIDADELLEDGQAAPAPTAGPSRNRKKYSAPTPGASAAPNAPPTVKVMPNLR